MSKIFFEMPEEVLKQATLIASRYSDKTILSIIEECFNYGAKSLYTDVPKPVPPERKEPEFNQKIDPVYLNKIKEMSEQMADSSQDAVYESYDEEDIPESYGKPVITADGFFEL